jgi:hypothetical protein
MDDHRDTTPASTTENIAIVAAVPSEQHEHIETPPKTQEAHVHEYDKKKDKKDKKDKKEKHHDDDEKDKDGKKKGVWHQIKDGVAKAEDKMEKALEPIEHRVNKKTASANHSINKTGHKMSDKKEKKKHEKEEKKKHLEGKQDATEDHSSHSSGGDQNQNVETVPIVMPDPAPEYTDPAPPPIAYAEPAPAVNPAAAPAPYTITEAHA